MAIRLALILMIENKKTSVPGFKRVKGKYQAKIKR